jgi:hypothetical protein
MNHRYNYVNFAIFLSAMFYCATSVANPVPCGSTLAIVAAPVTISNSGNYKVSQDIAGTITIDADNVHLDLNHKRLTAGAFGIVVTAGHQDITISNGIIESASVNGIDISGAVNVLVQKIDFVSNSIGVLVVTTTGITIDSCTFRGHTTNCVRISEATGSAVSNCIMEQNVGPQEILVDKGHCFHFQNVEICNNSFSGGTYDAIRLNDSQDIRFFDCTASLNTGDAEVNIYRFNTCNNIETYRCDALDNKTSSTLSTIRGFFMVDSKNILFDLCQSNSNSGAGSAVIHGFDTNATSQDIVFISCIANRNLSLDSGTVVGFFIESDISCLIKCVAKNNSSVVTGAGHGFLYTASSSDTTTRYSLAKNNKTSGFNNSGTNNVFLTNESQGHGASGASNFVGVPTPFINTLAPATDWTSTVTPFNNISVTAP